MKLLNQLSAKSIAACLLLFPLLSWAGDTSTVCSKDQKTLKAHSGVYADIQLLDIVKKTRLWQMPSEGANAVNIAKDGTGKIIYAWHEAMGFEEVGKEECMTFSAGTLQFQNKELSPAQFIRIADINKENAAYFNLIFHGCYLDQSNREWCFSPQKIRIGKVVHSAELMLDRSELPDEGNVLKLKSEKLFWVFKPQGDAWLVLKSDWASSEKFHELNWSKPWMTLRPVTK